MHTAPTLIDTTFSLVLVAGILRGLKLEHFVQQLSQPRPAGRCTHVLQEV